MRNTFLKSHKIVPPTTTKAKNNHNSITIKTWHTFCWCVPGPAGTHIFPQVPLSPPHINFTRVEYMEFHAHAHSSCNILQISMAQPASQRWLRQTFNLHGQSQCHPSVLCTRHQWQQHLLGISSIPYTQLIDFFFVVVVIYCSGKIFSNYRFP